MFLLGAWAEAMGFFASKASLSSRSITKSYTSPCGSKCPFLRVQVGHLFTGAWSRAMGFLGAVAGSAAGAILSSTRRGARRGAGDHAIWMAFGAAAGIEGMQTSAIATLCTIAGCGKPWTAQGRWQLQQQVFISLRYTSSKSAPAGAPLLPSGSPRIIDPSWRVCCCSGAAGAAHRSQDGASRRGQSAAAVSPAAGAAPDQAARPSCLPGLPGTPALKMLHSRSAPFHDEELRSPGNGHVAWHLLAIAWQERCPQPASLHPGQAGKSCIAAAEGQWY